MKVFTENNKDKDCYRDVPYVDEYFYSLYLSYPPLGTYFLKVSKIFSHTASFSGILFTGV